MMWQGLFGLYAALVLVCVVNYHVRLPMLLSAVLKSGVNYEGLCKTGGDEAEILVGNESIP